MNKDRHRTSTTFGTSSRGRGIRRALVEEALRRGAKRVYAGFLYDDLSDRAALEQHLDVNFFGTYAVTQASCRPRPGPGEPSSIMCL